MGANYDGPFKNCPLSIDCIDLKNIEEIHGFAFSNCNLSGILNISKVKTIARDAFSYNNITEVVFNEDGAFYNKISGGWVSGNPIRKLIFPEGFVSNESNQFNGLSNCYCEYPESYTGRISMSSNALNSILHIKRKTDTTKWENESITNFNYTQVLKYLYIETIEPPTCTGNIFGRGSAPDKIFVPIGSLDVYKEATNWNRYSSLFEEFDYENDDVPQIV